MLITVVAGIVGLITCIQYRTNILLENEEAGSVWQWLDNIVFKALRAFNIETVEDLKYGYRPFSTFPNPNMLAQYLVMAAPFVACYNFMKPRKAHTLWFGRTCLFFTFVGVMLSGSRGGYFAILILAATLILLNIRRHFWKTLLCLIVSVLSIPNEVYYRLFTVKKGILVNSSGTNGLATVLKSNSVASGALSSGNAEVVHKTNAALGERWEIWNESITQFSKRPIWGYGAGTQTTLEMYKAIGIDAPHAHNIVLQLLLEGGIVALIIMGLIGFFVVRNGIRLVKAKNTRSFWIGFSMLAFIICFMTHGMVDYPLMAPKLILFFITVLGVINQAATMYTPTEDRTQHKLFKQLRRNKA